MSVIIKTSEMQYKDNAGVYHGINAVAEKRTSDIIADMDDAVQAMQEAADGIESQRQTMIASIASVAGQGTDTTLSQSGVAADAKAAGDEISDLKSATLNDENMLISSDIVDGYRFNAAGSPTSASGYFVSKRIHINYPGLKYYKNSVVEDAYHRYVLLDEEDNVLSVGTENIIQTTIDTYSIRISGTSAEESTAFLGLFCARDIIARNPTDFIGPRIYGKGYASARGNLSNGEHLSVRFTNLKKNNIYSFTAKITSFSSVIIGHSENVYGGSWIEITGTKVIAHYYDTSDHTTEHTHGITIGRYLFAQIVVGVGKAKIQIYSNDVEYIIPEVTWSGDGNGMTFVSSNGSTLTDCVLTWSSEDFRKNIWLFGDSYFGMTTENRWCYYLVRDGFVDNVLLNAFPGETSLQNLASLQRMIEDYGKPKYIVWCAGMNDGSDANENTPSSDWMTSINSVLTYCEKFNITPIFATIPTVPNIYHEGKNAWVRNSGYRYIDFSRAVNASSSGVWYTGMLSSDNVHPTELGAKALYYQAIADMPEITFFK